MPCGECGLRGLEAVAADLGAPSQGGWSRPLSCSPGCPECTADRPAHTRQGQGQGQGGVSLRNVWFLENFAPQRVDGY